jgi:hypothetical protein
MLLEYFTWQGVDRPIVTVRSGDMPVAGSFPSRVVWITGNPMDDPRFEVTALNERALLQPVAGDQSWTDRVIPVYVAVSYPATLDEFRDHHERVRTLKWFLPATSTEAPWPY